MSHSRMQSAGALLAPTSTTNTRRICLASWSLESYPKILHLAVVMLNMFTLG